MIPAIITNQNLTLIIKGKQRVVSRDSGDFQQIMDAIQADDEDLVEILTTPAKAVEVFMKDGVEVRDGRVLFNGKEVDNLVVDKIFAFMSEGLPYQPLVSFLSRLMANPSYQSIKELYPFLESKGIPIDADGFFYCYKAVREDWMDKYSGTIFNGIGTVVALPRNEVDDNRDAACSRGLHAGNLDYVSAFAGQGDKIVIVKIDPADVVSVPSSDERKLRCCKYEVVAEYTEPLKSTIYGDVSYPCDCDTCTCEEAAIYPAEDDPEFDIETEDYFDDEDDSWDDVPLSRDEDYLGEDDMFEDEKDPARPVSEYDF